MALNEDEIRENIAKLETALARGEDTVQYADRMVRYKSSSAIREAIAYFKGLLTEASGGRSKQIHVFARNGF